MIDSKATRIFRIFNGIFLILAALSCIIPFIHIIAVSFSSSAAVTANMVGLWPVFPTTSAYVFLLNRVAFWTAFGISIQRVLLGTFINMLLVVLIGYPLSKENVNFRFRTVYVWYFFFTAVFSGGLIPLFMLIHRINLLDSIWALVLPSAVGVFNVVLMLNFFRQIPKELEEASFIDGAGHIRTLFQIYIPCSMPAIATITLFAVVGHWNAWFDGLIFMNHPSNYPLQSFLQTVIIGLDFSQLDTLAGDYERLRELTDRTLKASQIIIATIPVLAVYPFLQKYFVTGIVLGSVKG